MTKIGKITRKFDADAIVEGRARYTEDYVDPHALTVKLMRSPYASCEILSIDKTRAEEVEGIEAIFTYEDVPQTRSTMAGQSYPEPSPQDRLILDKTIRYWNEPVAIVAGTSEQACLDAMRLIKIEYKVKEALLDPEKAIDSPLVVHEEEVFCLGGNEVFGYEPQRNIAGSITRVFGDDFEETYQASPVQIEEEYSVFPQAHTMMETYRSYAYLDELSRLNIVSSTQVPFHIKRQLARILEIPDSRIRIKKPRVGGGFGGKQTSVTEMYVAFVTLKTGKPSYLAFDREETQTASNSRHGMKIKVRLGAEKDGMINGIRIDALSDQGAYGEHAFTTLNLVGDKSLPIYNKMKSAAYYGKVVYTNKMPGAAFRGYGAVQGIFAVESTVNELAAQLNMDPVEVRMKNVLNEGEETLAYNMNIQSCRLKDCIKKGKEAIKWDDYYPYKIEGDKIVSVGMACAMQGSGIANVDTSTVEIRLNEQGDYTLFMSPTDTGTGTDTIMMKIAAESLGCEISEITPVIADTDITPFDPGSYASSGVYITGSSVYRAAEDLKEMIKKEAAKMVDTYPSWLDVVAGEIKLGNKTVMTVKDLAQSLASGPNGKNIVGIGHFDSKVSPPPFMAGFAKVAVDRKTGQVEVLEYAAAVDCGQVMAKNLATIQVEGGVVQSIGYTLYEDTTWNEYGIMNEKSFLNYKIPTRKEVGPIHVDFCETYEPTGPFGAKSIGELVSDTPAPAIAGALRNALKVPFTSIPIAKEEVLKALKNLDFYEEKFKFL